MYVIRVGGVMDYIVMNVVFFFYYYRYSNVVLMVQGSLEQCGGWF